MSELSSAIRAVCEEKGLSYDSVIETIEMALAAAYRKDYGQKNQNIKVKFNPETGESKVTDVKVVVEDLPEDYDEEAMEEKEGSIRNELKESAQTAKDEKNSESKEAAKEKVPAQGKEGEEKTEDEEEIRKFNPKTEIQLSDAKLIKKDSKLEDEIITDLEVPKEYGRMAAQTAKQVIIQKLREAEREMVFNEFKDKENEVVSGVVQRREGRNILVDLGKAVGRILPEDQIYGENYNPGDKIKVYVREVRAGSKGAEIILSRTSEEILKKIFYLEIPEIANGLLEIKGVAREAGSRSKVAIWTDQENVDPIGSCVGQRGSRIQTIISELGGERVDMVEWDEDPAKYIANALSPAKIVSVDINEEDRVALVKVNPDQLSLAIGKKGQNVRLAARLTGWKIDIMEEGDGTSINLKAEDDSGESASAKATVDEGKEDKKDKKKKEKNEVLEDKPKDESTSAKATVDEGKSAQGGLKKEDKEEKKKDKKTDKPEEESSK